MGNEKQPDADLNAIIASAVNARVEAAVVEALSGDDVMGRYVTAALQRPVEVPDGPYGKKRVSFLSHIIEQAVRDATKVAVQKYMDEESESLQDEVRKAMKRSAPEMAERMIGQLVKVAGSGYGIQVSLRTGE